MLRTLTVFLFMTTSFYIWSQNDSVFTQFEYPSGQISSEGYLVDGRPEGYWKTYYTDGTLKSEGSRKNFQLDSTWTFYNNVGQVTEKINYVKGKRNGITDRFKEEELIERCEYVNDTLSGTCEEYLLGKIRREIPFVGGKQEGKGYVFNSNGDIVEILYFKAGFLRNSERINRLDKLGRKQGPWREFYQDRTSKMEGTYVDGEKNGLFKYFDEKGEIVRLEKYENGELNDEAAETTVVDIRNEYYGDGRIKSSGSYKDGQKHGVHRDYDEDGNIIASRIYEYGKEVASGIIGRSGRFDGPWKELYEDGTTKEEGAYKDGLRTDKWKFYYPNGKVSQRGSFRKGKPNGEWKWYYPNGELRREETYRNGREDGMSVEYDINGNILAKGNYLDGLKEGEWIYRQGDHVITGSYVGGEKDGDWRGEYDNGKTQFKGEFQRGFAIGKHKFYFATGQLMQDGKFSSGRRQGEWRRFDEDGEIILRSTYESGIERRLEGVKILPTYEELDID